MHYTTIINGVSSHGLRFKMIITAQKENITNITYLVIFTWHKDNRE